MGVNTTRTHWILKVCVSYGCVLEVEQRKQLFWMLKEKMISNLHTQLLSADHPPAALQALGPAVVRRHRVQGLHYGRSEEGVMAVHRQWALPFSVDAQDLQLLTVTGHVGGARGVHTQTLWGGAALCAVLSKGIAVFCRGRKIWVIFWYIICTKGGNVYLYTWKKLFKCMQHWHRGFQSSSGWPGWQHWTNTSAKIMWAQPDMQDKCNYSILTIKSDNVSFPVSWSANIFTFWMYWCLRMINQLMWHLSWNPFGLLNDSIFEMQLPSFTCVL